ncbi:MAG: hypothetical protein Ct9H300mP8_02900 [Gammaproteobacteria bacterium]|nr:MAG: hypothetical protein Ct9H300mP8_02900 [Gammaproteobacteria bacterium]
MLCRTYGHYPKGSGRNIRALGTRIHRRRRVHKGAVMESLGERKGVLLDVINDGDGRVRLNYRVATRALMGFRSEFASMTSGLV